MTVRRERKLRQSAKTGFPGLVFPGIACYNDAQTVLRSGHRRANTPGCAFPRTALPNARRDAVPQTYKGES